MDNETPDLEGIKYATIDSSDISGGTKDETEKVSSDEKIPSKTTSDDDFYKKVSNLL